MIGAIPMTMTRWGRRRADAPLRVLRHLRGPPRSSEQSGPPEILGAIDIA